MEEKIGARENGKGDYSQSYGAVSRDFVTALLLLCSRGHRAAPLKP